MTPSLIDLVVIITILVFAVGGGYEIWKRAKNRLWAIVWIAFWATFVLLEALGAPSGGTFSDTLADSIPKNITYSAIVWGAVLALVHARELYARRNKERGVIKMVEKIKSFWQTILLIPFIVIWGIISAFQPGAGIRAVAVPQPSEWLTMSVGAVIALVVSKYIAEWLAYGLVWLNLPANWRDALLYIGNLVLVAFVTGMAHFIPQAWLDKPLLDALFALFALIASYAGGRTGASAATMVRMELFARLGVSQTSSADPLNSKGYS